MFVLAKLQDVVRIAPWQFDKPLTEAVSEELNRKLSNRVLYSVGLCIALHDIVKLEESFILPGDGASHSRTTFRYVVFRPYVDEVLTGRIKGCSSEGVQGEVERERGGRGGERGVFGGGGIGQCGVCLAEDEMMEMKLAVDDDR